MNSIVTIQHREAITTSLIVADVFGKRHDHVLEAIRKMVQDLPNGGAPYFRGADYVDGQGKTRPMFEMGRDGYSLLAMGFTGKKALEFKLKFINAFNLMEKSLLNQQNLSWKEQRAQGKIARKAETDTIKTFVEYATAQGSQKASMYYMNVTKMTHKALEIMKEAGPQSIRDTIDAMQLSVLSTAEFIVCDVLNNGMAAGLHYKDIFQAAKNNVTAFAATVPKRKMIT